jgi:hypothetical protein
MIEERDVGMVVPVTISGPRHCGSSCRFMQDPLPAIRNEYGHVMYEAKPAYCRLLAEPIVLVWDKKRKHFGYKRTQYCRSNEVTDVK